MDFWGILGGCWDGGGVAEGATPTIFPEKIRPLNNSPHFIAHSTFFYLQVRDIDILCTSYDPIRIQNMAYFPRLYP